MKANWTDKFTDEQWVLAAPLLRDPRRPDGRRIMSGIIYKLETGCRWSEIPKEYGNQNIIQQQHSALVQSGRLNTLLAIRPLNTEHKQHFDIKDLPPDRLFILSDTQWKAIQPLLLRRGAPGRRTALSGIVLALAMGNKWSVLPEEYGDYKLLKKKHHDYLQHGIVDGIVAKLLEISGCKSLKELVEKNLKDDPHEADAGCAVRQPGTLHLFDEDFEVMGPPGPNVIELPGGREMIYKSLAMQHVVNEVTMIAPTQMPVVIIGETGTGKENLALLIHKTSLVNTDTFISFNSATVAGDTAKAELFGYEKGAFTGAAATTKGLFERAEGGTLFIDEITKMPLDIQAQLLRALQDKVIRRVGGTREIKVNARIVTALNESPFDAIVEGRLLPDLYHRLGHPIIIQPLRENREDIAYLAEYFAQGVANKSDTGIIPHFSLATTHALQKHDWPGNVRELKTVVEAITHWAILLNNGVISHDLLKRYQDKERQLANMGRYKHKAMAESAVEICEAHPLDPSPVALDSDFVIRVPPHVSSIRLEWDDTNHSVVNRPSRHDNPPEALLIQDEVPKAPPTGRTRPHLYVCGGSQNKAEP